MRYPFTSPVTMSWKEENLIILNLYRKAQFLRNWTWNHSRLQLQVYLLSLEEALRPRIPQVLAESKCKDTRRRHTRWRHSNETIFRSHFPTLIDSYTIDPSKWLSMGGCSARHAPWRNSQRRQPGSLAERTLGVSWRGNLMDRSTSSRSSLFHSIPNIVRHNLGQDFSLFFHSCFGSYFGIIFIRWKICYGWKVFRGTYMIFNMVLICFENASKKRMWF